MMDSWGAGRGGCAAHMGTVFSMGVWVRGSRKGGAGLAGRPGGRERSGGPASTGPGVTEGGAAMRAGLALAAVTTGSDRAGGAACPGPAGGLGSWSDPCGISARGGAVRTRCGSHNVGICLCGSSCARCVTVMRVGWFWRGGVGQGGWGS